VQDGCNQFCTYCIVPYTRGPVRSRPGERVVDEVSQLVAAGFKEIVLTGIHTSAYGLEWRDEKGHPNLADLVQIILEQVPGLQRLRISSLEPTEIPETLLEIMADSPVLCRHLHIPLQSGDDQILREMHRPYTAGQYLTIVERLRKAIPGLAITTDVMVGFPGETEAHFQRSFDFIQELGFSDLHVFKYSPRTGTPAAAFKNQVPAKVKESRSQQLLALTAGLKLRFAAEFAGKTLTVLLEEETELLNPKSGVLDGLEQDEPVKLSGSSIRCWMGYTDNYLRVAIPTAERFGSTNKPLSAGNLSPGHEPLAAGSLIPVILQPANPEFSWGRLIESTEI
jgi:threonylcarbamoyladenosine tRNA methylthiotransferase MtaB